MAEFDPEYEIESARGPSVINSVLNELRVLFEAGSPVDRGVFLHSIESTFLGTQNQFLYAKALLQHLATENSSQGVRRSLLASFKKVADDMGKPRANHAHIADLVAYTGELNALDKPVTTEYSNALATLYRLERKINTPKGKKKSASKPGKGKPRPKGPVRTAG